MDILIAAAALGLFVWCVGNLTGRHATDSGRNTQWNGNAPTDIDDSAMCVGMCTPSRENCLTGANQQEWHATQEANEEMGHMQPVHITHPAHQWSEAERLEAWERALNEIETEG